MIGPILAAMAFLTRLPVPAFIHTRSDTIRQAARWFPLIGLLLGGIYAGFAYIALYRLPSSVVAVLVVALDALLTGALHLDGLADMADGFGGGKTREEVLRIMRDHAIGSYGACALIAVMLLKTVCITGLLENRRNIWILFVAPTFSRWSILLLAKCTPYARQITDGPTGTGALSQSFSKIDLAIGTALCLPLLVVPGPVRMLACWATSALCTTCVARISVRRIGGVTGDVLGANTVVSEAAQYVVAILVSVR